MRCKRPDLAAASSPKWRPQFWELDGPFQGLDHKRRIWGFPFAESLARKKEGNGPGLKKGQMPSLTLLSRRRAERWIEAEPRGEAQTRTGSLVNARMNDSWTFEYKLALTPLNPRESSHSICSKHSSCQLPRTRRHLQTPPPQRAPALCQFLRMLYQRSSILPSYQYLRTGDADFPRELWLMHSVNDTLPTGMTKSWGPATTKHVVFSWRD